jgi:spore maturation protein CgeB
MIDYMRWMLVLPPEGAARIVALKTADAFQKRVGLDCFKYFDTLTYIQVFKKLLSKQDDNLIIDLVNQALIISCLDFGTSHLITRALSPVTLFTLNLLRKQNIKTIHWFYEDYQRALYWKDIINGYDYFFSIQKGNFAKICHDLGINYHFLPTASSAFKIADINQSGVKYDIAFVGIPSSYRIYILEKLHNLGYKLAIAGSGWNSYTGPLEKVILSSSWTNEEEMNEIFTHSKIGLNLSVENPQGRNDVHISPRAYDILACGSILLTEDVPLIYDCLKECRFHSFTDHDDVCRKTETLLNSADQEKTFAEANRILINKSHTYQNRIEEIIFVCSTQ